MKVLSPEKVPRTVKLTVSSAHGNPDPPRGVKTYDGGKQILCKVTSPEVEVTSPVTKATSPATEGQKGPLAWLRKQADKRSLKVWTCDGWNGTGSVPKSGEGTDVTFPLDEDSTIAWKWTQSALYTTPGAAQAASLTAFVAIIIFAAVFYESKHVFLTVAFAGALGGLLHEIVQSGGKYVLPNTDDKGNFALGGLIGIVTGGLAGLILYQGLNVTTGIILNVNLLAEALLAGLATKGVADAVNPPSKSS